LIEIKKCLSITRTVGSISSSRFLLLLLHPRQICNSLYRDAAPVPFTSFIYREKYPVIYQTCTATAPVFYKICTMTAKSAPYLPCTGTAFWPRWRGVPGPCPDAASGNTNYSYHRAVIGKLTPADY